MTGWQVFFACSGRGDPAHGGTVPCEDTATGRSVEWVPGRHPRRPAIEVRCPVPACGRRERIGGRRQEAYMRRILAGELALPVDISGLHR
jgi:hypothetical protein